MSNFAERLVARSTGRAADAGVPLLMPRPVARFEPTGGLSTPGEALLEDTGMVLPGPADALPDGADPRAEAHVQDADPSIDRTDRPATQPAAPTGDAFGRPLPPGHASSNGGRGDHVNSSLEAGAAPPAREADEPAAMPEVRRQPGGGDARANVGSEPLPPARGVVASEPATAPPVQDVMALSAPPAPAAEQGGPAISIGKIEVQFLPKETPPGLPRAQPQRTRGFHAYDRARRGLR
jgi:hypothetical protein